MVLTIEKIVYPGRRLGRHEGKVVFTDRGLPGEVVEVEVVRDRKSYTEARTARIVEAAAASASRGAATTSFAGPTRKWIMPSSWRSRRTRSRRSSGAS
jgi:tRNA/tmRNA/rRNA uracil-C5-methylase (TrmA/RlmC/RlmD family)